MRLQWIVAFMTTVVAVLPATDARAWLPGDLNGSGTVNVADVQLAIQLALLPLEGSSLPVPLDSDQDGIPNGLENVGSCASGTIRNASGDCVVDAACTSVVDCDDANPCTTDSCAAGSGCTHVANSEPCDDANPCTGGDLCSSTACIPGALIACDDGDPCTTDSCGVSMGCVHLFEPTLCPESGPSAGTIGPDGWPVSNVYSWDGSWVPAAGEFPLSGMFDDEYFDGHTNWNGVVSPILPPGEWDWDDANDDLANWKNFSTSIGVWAELVDAAGNLFGWQLQGNTPQSIPYSGAAAYYEGTNGTEVLDLGPGGIINSFTNGNLRDGPDVLVFNSGWSLDFRTGSTGAGSERDNDLVIGGCEVAPTNDFTYHQATIHTGPGRDWVFARNVNGAAIDAGNGDGGITDALDPTDGNDLVMIAGNARDFRVFGGYGSDTVVWYLDDANIDSIAFGGPNFFGGGGSGEALWADPGVDRLVFVIPPDTAIVDSTPTPPGSLLVRVWDEFEDEIWWDAPVYDDPYARYCITCGTGPAGQKTINFEYLSADESFFTGWFWVTEFEELQLGDGPDAIVYAIDPTNATLTVIPDAEPTIPPAWPWEWCE